MVNSSGILIETSPLRLIVSTLSTICQVSQPKAPAFILRAPPKVPGMPAKNSAPIKPCSLQNLAICAHGTPASAKTLPSSVKRSVLRRFLVLITVPRSPPSLISTLLPSPNQNSGSSWGRCWIKAMRSTLFSGKYRQSAGPPIRQLVYLASFSLTNNCPVKLIGPAILVVEVPVTVVRCVQHYLPPLLK